MEYLELIALIVFFGWCCLPDEVDSENQESDCIQNVPEGLLNFKRKRGGNGKVELYRP